MPAFQSERLSKQRYAGEMCVCPGRQQLPAAALILEKAIPGTYGGTTTGTVSEAMTITMWTAPVAVTTGRRISATKSCRTMDRTKLS